MAVIENALITKNEKYNRQLWSWFCWIGMENWEICAWGDDNLYASWGISLDIYHPGWDKFV